MGLRAATAVVAAIAALTASGALSGAVVHGTERDLRSHPVTQEFASIPLESPDAAVRQMLGRPGEVWGAESGADKLVVVYTR